MNTAPAGSLRRRLLGALLLPLLALLGAGVAVDYHTGLRLAGEAYDYALIGTAIGLAARLELDQDHDLDVDLPAAAEAVLRADPFDRIDFAVWDGHDRLVSGNPQLRALAEPVRPTGPVFRDAWRNGERLRVVTYPYAGPEGVATIVVSETCRKRERATAGVLMATVWPNVLMVAATLLIVFFGVRFALAPLDALGREIDRRKPDELGPVPLAAVPAEARPPVAALNRLMQRLERAAAAQRDFLSASAHQLRTPLAGLLTQIELARDGGADAARLAAMHATAGRLARLTQQMLALARSGPDAGAGQPQARVDLVALLEDAASEQLDRALERGIDLGFDPQPALVDGSAWLLHELLANLIDNALAYTPAGGTVTVRCAAAAGSACLEVEDDGPGIPEPARRLVTGRYYRLPGSPGSGSGLGLAIVQEVAARHGASLTITDGAGGRGTCVRVSFPARG